jgi:ribosomal protein S18 acetylase RimI-like enzyme
MATPGLVRIAEVGDVELILPMMEAFNRFEEISWSRENGEPALRRLVADSSLGLVGVLEEAETQTPVGYFVLTWGYDLEWNGRDAFLTELWVADEARGQGVGRRALACIEALAFAHGAKALHLLVRHENVAAQRLYAANGFVSPKRLFLTKQLTASS